MHELTNTQLIDQFSDVVRRDRASVALMLRYVTEIDARKAWAEHACSSMFAFLVERFHMSEDEAYKRIAAARAAKRYPAILDMIEHGDLHLSAVVLLASHLTADNHREVLARAFHKTRKQVMELVAELAPRSDKATVIRAVPQAVLVANSEDTSPQGKASTSSFQLVSKPVETKVTPLAPKRYHLSTTVSDRARDALRQLRGLCEKDEAAILEEALEHLLEKKLKQKAALTSRPRASRADGRKRKIPAATRREVFTRDEQRCAYIDETGQRCSETRHLEFHHLTPWARGGEHSSTNVALRCRAHNLFEAERDYGVTFMRDKIDGVREPLTRYTATARIIEHATIYRMPFSNQATSQY